MKNLVYSFIAMCVFTSFVACDCGSSKKAADKECDKKEECTKSKECTEMKKTVVAEHDGIAEYVILDRPQVDLSKFEKDAEGWITIFDGKSFDGWRGYNKEKMPTKWILEDGAMKFNGSGAGEAQDADGGDIIFAHKFKNFEVSIDWKVAKGSNSGIFYLAQEVEGQAIYISAPESQVLDNINHVDAKAGKDGNRQSSSLYDMIPAKPQNAKPIGEWNNTKITVYKGTVLHNQNEKNVVEYHLWTKEWTEMLMASKFSKEKWPIAFELLNNCGGANHEGYIGLQDHGDDVWFRSIKVKILD